MKGCLTILVLVASFLIVTNSFASEQQADEAALHAFQPIVTKVAGFFNQNPKLLVKISPPEKNESSYFMTHFLFRKVNYDIHKTNSIVTPYQAIIGLDTDVLDNKPCGDTSFDSREPDGWKTPESALQFTDTQSCYFLRTRESGPIRHRFVFVYKALEKKWALNEIFYQDGKPNGRFLVLLDIPSPWFPKVEEPQVRNFNQGWRELFIGLK